MVKFKDQLKKIIFGTETFGGRLFDILLIFAITSSVLIVMLDSVSEYHDAYGKVFIQIEWIFTILFTLEYILRIYCIRLPSSYIFSFFGIIDFLALIPTYLSIFLPGTEVLAVVRVLRVLRVFRVFHFYLRQLPLQRGLGWKKCCMRPIELPHPTPSTSQ